MTKDEVVEKLIESAKQYRRLTARRDIFINRLLKSGMTIGDSEDIVCRHFDKERELFADLDKLIEVDEQHKLNDGGVIQEGLGLRERLEELEK